MEAAVHPLKAYRDRNGISLAKLAEAAGTTRQSLFRIEAGTQSPTLEMMARICAATDNEVTANDFMSANRVSNSPAPASPEAA